MAGLVCAVFIVLTCNIVTGIMLGFVTLVVGRVFAREWQKLNIGTVIITAALVAFYAGGWAICIDSPAPFSAEISFTEDSHRWQQYAAGGLA